MVENELVRYSRAGDVFHYRWAARRCLRLIYPKSPISEIVIEGSKERHQAGEYIIDVAEYTDPTDDSPRGIAYFQLKHSTVRTDQLFQISDLIDTIEGFAKRYSEQFRKEGENRDSVKVFFLDCHKPADCRKF